MQPEPQKYGFIWFLTPQKVQNMVFWAKKAVYMGNMVKYVHVATLGVAGERSVMGGVHLSHL